MAAPMEVMLSTDASGMLWNVCIWDFHSGTALQTYKGGSSGPRGLCCLSGQFLMSAAIGKPIIYIWALQKKEQQQQRIVCPGVVSCLAASPDNTLCAAGIAEKIHIWQTCSGYQLSVLSHHYQTVTCLCFTDDGSHLVSGGEDNLVMVWYTASILQPDSKMKSCEPLFVWSKHALPITDVHCGIGGARSRVVSASHDQTCKLWDLATGQLLCNFVFDSPVCSVAMDMAEYHLFAGCSDGNIYQVNLFASPVQMERHISKNKESEEMESSVFRGHSKPVTCLSVSMDGTVLASGSQDNTACIWHVNSKQKIRTLSHKGAVTNVVFTPTPANLLDSRSKPTFPLQSFKRHLLSAESDGGRNMGGEIAVRVPDQESTVEDEDRTRERVLIREAVKQQQRSSTNKPNEPSRQQLEQELERLTQTNRLLFKAAADLASR
ncbi:WD repeat-containing protein 18-like isoform X2 [Patiria miniata]|uniref:TEP-1 C-terminal beta-propeller domain-containing protein n=1 Tax=Patiria miniata TaxID=46514 RepID=A0A913ZA36_PATMI|nr:WD repeat-containing protein 18-like isoform X2 [Patiria miniata]